MSLLSNNVPPVHVTDDRVARSKVWVAILVHTNCEHRAASQLEKLSIESFVAAQEEMHRWSDRMKKIQRVVIPSIVFVLVEPQRFNELKRLSFVRGLMTYPGMQKPAEIPEQQMQMLKFMLGQSDNPVGFYGGDDSMKIGEMVRVIRGPLTGLEGVLYRLDGNELHVCISISELGWAHAQVSTQDIAVIRNRVIDK